MSLKDSNFYSVQAFMRTRLKLKGLELELYAIIYGFSQTGNQYFTGNLSYLSEWTGCTKQGLIKALKALEYKEYISKSECVIDGARVIRYKALKTIDNFSENSTNELNTVEQGVKLSLTGVLNSVEQGVKLSLTDGLNSVEQNGKQSLPTHYNINNISDTYNDIYLGKKKSKKQESEFVVPSLEEVRAYITECNFKVDADFFYDYYKSRGWKLGQYVMDDWKATVRNWNRKNTKEESESKSDGSMDKYEFVFNIFNTYTDEHGEEHSAYWDEDKEQYYIWDSETNIREYVDNSRVKRA